MWTHVGEPIRQQAVVGILEFKQYFLSVGIWLGGRVVSWAAVLASITSWALVQILNVWIILILLMASCYYYGLIPETLKSGITQLYLRMAERFHILVRYFSRMDVGCLH